MKWFMLVMIVLMVQSAAALSVELLNTDPAPIVAGEYADVTVRVMKDSQDGPSREVTLIMEGSSFITPVSEMGKKVTNFRSGDTITHTFRLFFSENLPEGFVDLPLLVQFDGGTLREELRVFVQESESNPEIFVGEIRTVPAELLPDTDDNKLTITLQNLGDKDAELVRAELVVGDENVKPSYSYSFVASVASIGSGDEAEFVFTVDLPEGVFGSIPAELVLRYRAQNDAGESYETFSERLPFSLDVADAPFLRVVNVTFLDSMEAGSTENRVRVLIRNDGVDDAEEVRVRALPDISYPFIFELTTEYVSSKIEPGEEAYVEFKVEVVRDAAVKEYPITLRLESLVGETRYSREDTMTLVAREGRKLSVGQFGQLLIAVAILFSLYLGVKTYRGRGKKK